MAIKVISISKQSKNNELYITDNEGHAGSTITTKAKPGDTIIWELVPEGGIDQITGIIKRAVIGNIDVFSKPPAPINPKDPQTPWQGTISENVTGKEIYDIEYMIKGQKFLGDPEVEIEDEDED